MRPRSKGLDKNLCGCYLEVMDEAMRSYRKPAERIIRSEAHKWYILNEADQEDVIQDTLARILQYPPDLSVARDVKNYYLSHILMNAKVVIMRRRGYHNGEKRAQSAKAAGEQATSPIGLYQVSTERETDIIDERILPPVASAEDTYMASLPSKRQEDLRGAIERLAPNQRTALVLRYYEELSVEDVALAMNVTYDQASRTLADGMRNLRKQLKPRKARRA
jgi:RNA polymerase sigma factor (sigma-70 family)